MDIRRPHRRTATFFAAAMVAAALAVPAAALAATDPLLSDQWALESPDGIGVKDAWTQSSGAGVVVAVLDSGVEIDHPDLRGAIWTNPGEIPGNGIDDDHNGFIDDVHGANMFNGGGDVSDQDGHGTHVAGIVGARKNDGVGGAGVAPGATIMPVKVLDSNGNGTSDLLAAGIRYAVDEGARILNASINGDYSSPALESAVQYAQDHGATIVTSAGNNDRNLDLIPSFPASLPQPAVMTVSATNRDGVLGKFSNWGPLTTDIAAPGVGIVSTAIGSSYEERSGTSMASPMVAGALALLSAVRPDLTEAQLRGVLLATARRPSGLQGLIQSGDLDVGAAMHMVRPGATWRSVGSASIAPRLRLRTAAAIRTGRLVAIHWTAIDAAAVTSWRVSLDGRVLGNLHNGAAHVLRQRVRRAGVHRWRVVGFAADGSKIVGATRSFRVLAAR